MKPFDIGWVPEGWTKGDPLYFSKSVPRGGRGFVSRVIVALDAGTIPCDECSYLFFHDQIPQVDAWFKWWNSEV